MAPTPLMPVLGKERVEVVRSLSIRGQPGQHSEPYRSVREGGGGRTDDKDKGNRTVATTEESVLNCMWRRFSPHHLPTFKFNFSLENTVSLNKRGRKPTPKILTTVLAVYPCLVSEYICNHSGSREHFLELCT